MTFIPWWGGEAEASLNSIPVEALLARDSASDSNRSATANQNRGQPNKHKTASTSGLGRRVVRNYRTTLGLGRAPPRIKGHNGR